MKKRILAFMLMTIMAFTVFAGCTTTANVEEPPAAEEPENENEEEEAQEPKREETAAMKIGLLKGPTAIGGVLMMDEIENGLVWGNYDIEIYSAPDEVTAKIINGDLDVAAVPVNVASTLYNKTEGGVMIAALNTLGTLYLVEGGNTVGAISDLSGQKVVMAGQGSTPEIVFRFILNKAGITDSEIEFVSNHAEAVSAVASGSASLALLPEPFASAAETKNENMRIALDLAGEWDRYSYEEEDVPNTLTMGCIVVRTEYVLKNQKAFNKFMDEYEFFVESSVEDPAYTAEFVVAYDIIDDLEAAEKAIPNCNIMYIEGSKMLRMVDNFLNIMYESNPASIGGGVPDDGFYYIRRS